MKYSKLNKIIVLLMITYINPTWAWTPTPSSNQEASAQSSTLSQPSKSTAGENGAKSASAAGPTYAECNYNNFGSETGSTLVNHVKSVNPTCLYDLFTASSVSTNALRHTNMTTIINAARTAAVNYQGTNEEGVEQLILFIRAGYFLASSNSVPAYTSAHQSLIQAFINDFEGNSHFYSNTTEEHAQSVYEFMTMLTNVDEEARGLPIANQLISNFNQTRAASFEQSASVNQGLNVLFYGFNNDAYKQAVTNNTAIIDTLFLLLRDKKWIQTVESGNRAYLYDNAAGELGRFVGIAGTKSLAKARIKSILSSLEEYSPAWLKIASMIDYFTPSECSEYPNFCGYKEVAIAQILPINHTCGTTLKLKTQDMTGGQLSGICSTLATQETYFHNQLNTGNSPVADDLNTDLQMIIFDSSGEYKKYGGPLYGIPTNNGGYYLEGDPSKADNQATFYAHEAEWLLPEFKVWNLEHEYVHYLDGRFNMYGDFGAPTFKSVWWSEGLAEYISLKDNNQAAIDTVNDGTTYTLQQVFDTTYDGFDVDRIYRWGYLAVRFMFQQHPNQVTSYLNATRAGNWNSAQTLINQWVSSYSNEFTSWTQTLSGGSSSGGSSSGGSSSGGSSSGGSSSGGSSSGGSSSGGSSSGGGLSNGQTVTGLSASQGNRTSNYYIDVPSGATNLSIKISGGTGDADLYVKKGSAPTDSSYDCRPYASGNNETCGAGGTALPTSAGRFYINAKAYSTFSGVSLTASYTAGGSSSGGSSSGGSSSGGSSSGGSSSGGSSSGGSSSGGSSSGGLSNGQTVTGLSAAANARTSTYYIDVPSGASSLSIKISGGTGDADLYVKKGSVPTDSSYDCRPYASGNNETCGAGGTSLPTSAGRFYINAKAYSAFSGVSLTASYTGGGSSSGGSSSGGSSSGGSSSGGSSSGGSSSGGSSSGGSSGGSITNACASEGPSTGSAMTSGDAICLPAGSHSNAIQYRYILVPANTGSMSIRTQHGTGNGNLYYNAGTWATSTANTQSSTNSGNTESITVNSPASGYRFMSVTGQQSGMTLLVELQ